MRIQLIDLATGKARDLDWTACQIGPPACVDGVTWAGTCVSVFGTSPQSAPGAHELRAATVRGRVLIRVVWDVPQFAQVWRVKSGAWLLSSHRGRMRLGVDVQDVRDVLRTVRGIDRSLVGLIGVVREGPSDPQDPVILTPETIKH